MDKVYKQNLECTLCFVFKKLPKKTFTKFELNTLDYCAANFSFAQLAKRKSLGCSKPATNSQAQALQHTVWNVSTISKPY